MNQPIDRQKIYRTRYALNLPRMCLLFLFFISFSLTAGAQITINKKDASLESILFSIRSQSGFDLFYDASDIKPFQRITANFNNVTVSHSLNEVLKGLPLQYKIEKKTITIVKKQNTQGNVQQTISGKVVDEEGKPVPGASVRLKSAPQKAVATKSDGTFAIPLNANGETLLVSFIGYKTAEIIADSQKQPLMVKLSKDDLLMNEVVVTGIVTRKKESFTGAVSSFSGAELKRVGNQNVIQSLRALDPSFIQIENNSMGSNPNVLPTLELRGQTSVSSSTLRDQFSEDPNQPLFILDGFESNLRTIIDLDMNIIESISILKDAASTALYGSRASNGVVVVETKKPEVGKIRLSYATDMMMELADLSGYNMMDAKEKLQFELLSGRYKNTSNDQLAQMKLEEQYAMRLKEANRGVNTYWLDKPLQNGFSNRHSITASGGDQNLTFNVGANYRSHNALMIGSAKKDWGANINVNYRKNKVNISNRAFVSNSSGDDSNYGSFADWVQLNPYYRYLDASEKYLENMSITHRNGYYFTVVNPRYNANLNSYRNSSSSSINNNTQMMVDITSNLRWQGAVQLSKTNSTSTAFTSPLNSAFDNTDIRKKGRYSNSESKMWSYTLNTMLTYAKVFAEKHSLTSNLRAEMQQRQNSLLGLVVEGFPNSSNGNPKFSFGYQEGSKPSTATALVRRNSVLGSVNYSYDGRFNADLSFNYDGSTAFGSNRKYAPYYSGGLSWNLHKEKFMENVGWIQSLRLRSNIGITGNQNFGSISSVSIYDYNQYINKYGQGMTLTALGNPDLEWQSTVQISSGLDLSAFGGRLNLQLNQFRKLTDPLVVAVNLPSSTGLSNYPFNAGALTVNGTEWNVRYSPIFRPKDNIVYSIGLTGSIIKQKYSKFDNQLASLNTQLRASNALTRFKDQYSPSALWSVKSLGIDPATGQELFETLDGQPTFTYNSAYQQVVGDSRPSAEGVISQSFSYKGFTMSMMFRYIFGRDILNSALFNKVENIGSDQLAFNQDRRALYDRWKNPGDHSEFKGISITTSTPMSSRFIQTENTISGESINIGYDFKNTSWLNKVFISNLRLTGYMNDIFYLSNIQRERGIDYPFARSFSFSLNATFK